MLIPSQSVLRKQTLTESLLFDHVHDFHWLLRLIPGPAGMLVTSDYPLLSGCVWLGPESSFLLPMWLWLRQSWPQPLFSSLQHSCQNNLFSWSMRVIEDFPFMFGSRAALHFAVVCPNPGQSNFYHTHTWHRLPFLLYPTDFMWFPIFLFDKGLLPISLSAFSPGIILSWLLWLILQDTHSCFRCKE